MKTKRKFLTAVLMSVFLMGLMTGCDALKETDEKIQAVVDAYKSADSEAFFKKMESNSASAVGLECLLDSVKSGNTEGIVIRMRCSGISGLSKSSRAYKGCRGVH